MAGPREPIINEYPSFLTPLGQLPVEYRQEIDRGYTTGWKSLDQYLQGLRTGELTIITADTGCGKTTFATQLIVNCAMQGIPCWINSWEMKPQVTMRKLASIVLRKPMKLIDFSQQDNEHFNYWCSRYSVYINPHTIGTDIKVLESQLSRAKDQNVRVVMLDHLDYLVGTVRDKLHEAIDETVKKLHELCVSLDMHFLLICHPKQAMEKDEVGLHSLKGSSSLKQYADNVIVLHRCNRTDSSAHPGKVRVKVVKNRMFGNEGNTYLWYQPQWDGYLELHDKGE